MTGPSAATAAAVRLWQLAAITAVAAAGWVWLTGGVSDDTGDRSVDVTVTWKVGQPVAVDVIIDGSGRAQNLMTGNYHQHREHWEGAAYVHAYALTRNPVALHCEIVSRSAQGTVRVDQDGGLHSSDDVRCSSAR